MKRMHGPNGKISVQASSMGKLEKYEIHTQFFIQFVIAPPISNGGFAHTVGTSVSCIVIWCGEGKKQQSRHRLFTRGKSNTNDDEMFIIQKQTHEHKANRRCRHNRKYISYSFLICPKRHLRMHTSAKNLPSNRILIHFLKISAIISFRKCCPAKVIFISGLLFSPLKCKTVCKLFARWIVMIAAAAAMSLESVLLS